MTAHLATVSASLLSLCLVALVDPVVAAGPTAGRWEVRPATSPIRIDGQLDEPAWADATVIPLAYEWFPGDNAPPPVATEALVTFDTRHLYLAFRAHDPDPSEIRANLMDRDSINTFVQDDHVTFMIDTFDDERRAFQFRVNPLGVQADALFSQVELVEDFSWDVIWASAGRITDDGYVVEVAVPFDQLRFPDGAAPQTWGFELGRSYPRSIRHRISANPRDRDNNCVLCQVDKLSGFVGMDRGKGLQITPTLTGNRTDEIDEFPDGELQAGDEEVEPGLDLRWAFTPSLTLNATLNPDFSQVEADTAQLAVNERFALFFPEKRPFFLEGVDLFSTPIDAVFTRTVVDPAWGLKLSGKQGRHAGGLFVTQDEDNSLLIPSNRGSAFAFLQGEEVVASVVRYRRDMGANSTLGVLYTGREGDGYHNRVGGIDGFLRLTDVDELRFQFLRSDTLYPEGIAADFDQPDESFSDEAFNLNYQHNARDWVWEVDYTDLGADFRADSGFVPRVDARTAQVLLDRVIRGEEDDWYTRWDLTAFVERTEDQGGRLTDQVFELGAQVGGPRQSTALVGARREEHFFDGIRYENLDQLDLFLQAQPTGSTKVSLYALTGETVDFANNQPADIQVINPTAEIKLGRHVNAQLQHVHQVLDVDGGELSRADLSQLRLVYNFTVRAFLRAIVQYERIERDPDLFSFPVPEETETLFSQLLFSYKLNPQTVLFLGTTEDRLGVDDVGLTETARTWFVKVGYAWVP